MKFRLTRPAIHDLAEIGRYTLKNWGEQQAQRYRTALSARLKWLCKNQHLWRQHPQLQEGVYTCTEQHHVIVFREYREGIEILRVLHERMDPARHLP